MRLETAATEGAHRSVFTILSGRDFARQVMTGVIETCLAVKDPLASPSGFNAVRTETLIDLSDSDGAEVTLKGVSTAGRTSRQFHNAHYRLEELTYEALQRAMNSPGHTGKIEFRVCIELIGDPIDTFPGSTERTLKLESKPKWVVTERADMEAPEPITVGQIDHDS